MHCPDCNSLNLENSNFCHSCGNHLISPSAGLPPDISFDKKLETLQRYLPTGLADKIISQKGRIEGERKLATVMFCDMQNFVPMVEKLGAEEAYAVMDQFYEILIHKVHEYEGTVNDMTGDGIMALFGVPIALEDAPQRAILTSLAIHDAMAGFSKKINLPGKNLAPLKMRIGIHTGPVIVGTLGNDLRVDFKAVGDTVNLASRIEKISEPGATYVTEKTYTLAKGLFYFEALGKKKIKGKKDSTRIYKVLYKSSDMLHPRPGSERMIYSNMVGRDRELDRLELQVSKAVNGGGSVVNIIGEAGIGKSRLIAELKKYDVINRVTFLEGRAISMGRNLSFHPIIDLLKQWAEIKHEDSEAASFYKLETAVKSVCQENVNDVLPFVATLMSMGLFGMYAERIKGIEGEALEALIFKNVREVLIKIAERKPLVLVIEDLHWSDTTSIELLEYLFRLAENQPILFINAFRHGHSETGDRIVETVNERLPVYSVELILEPLDENMSKALIASMLDINKLHHTIIDKIIQRAGGNPFFIEEVVQSFIDEGALVMHGRRFEITDKINTMAIPHTINDVLMARIDRLEEETRNLVKIASVIGRNFFYKILADVANTVEDIDNRLSYLKEIQLFRERKRMGEIEYLFNHALAQETTYGSILSSKRKDLHSQVARSIEKVFSNRINEFYGMLAYHYSMAENQDKTEEFLIMAGEEALRSSASNEALNFYKEALGLYLKKYGELEDNEKVAKLQKNIALALYSRGQNEEAIEFFDKALKYYSGELPKYKITKLFRFLVGMLRCLAVLYLPSMKFNKIPSSRDIEVLDLATKKCKALSLSDPERCGLESIYICGEVCWFDLNEFELGLEMFVGLSGIFSSSGMSYGLSRKILDFTRNMSPTSKPKIYFMYKFCEMIHNYLTGNWGAINNNDEGLVNDHLKIGELYDASQYLFWCGLACIYKGALDSAELNIEKLNDVYNTYGYDQALVLKYELNTNLLMERRKLTDALAEVERWIVFTLKSDNTMFLFDLYSSKGWINILMRDIPEAEKSLQNAKIEMSKNDTYPLMLTTYYCVQFQYLLLKLEESIQPNNPEKTTLFEKKTVETIKKLLNVTKKVPQQRVETYKLIGTYYLLKGKEKQAQEWWTKAIEEGERLGAQLELSRVYFEIGKRLLEADDGFNSLNGFSAKEYLEKARDLFVEMNLQVDLLELNKLMHG